VVTTVELAAVCIRSHAPVIALVLENLGNMPNFLQPYLSHFGTAKFL